MRFQRLIPVLALSVWAQCKPEELSPAAYVKYVRNPDNGFTVQLASSTLTFDAFYQPPAYVALTQLGLGVSDSENRKQAVEHNAAFYQFELRMSSSSRESIDEVLARIAGDSAVSKRETMLYRLQNKFSLTVGSDSIPCAFFLAQPTGQLDNAYRFMLAFEPNRPRQEKKTEEQLVLIYQDDLWSKQKLRFVFDTKKLNELPALKL
jgi:hypothetical protein